VPAVPVPSRNIGVYDLSNNVDYFPVASSSSNTKDVFPRVAGDLLTFIRATGGSSEIHLLDLRNPQNWVVIDSSPGVFPWVLSMGSLSGSNDLDPTNENDFVLSWIRFHGGGYPYEFKSCNSLSQCFQGVFNIGLPSGAAGAPGTFTGEEIREGHYVRETGVGAPLSQSDPMALYLIQDSSSSLISWHLYLSGAAIPITSPVPETRYPFYGLDVKGRYFSFSRFINPTTIEASIRDIYGSLSASLFQSAPPLGAVDTQLTISNLRSSVGRMLAFSRAINGRTSVHVSFIEGLLRIPVVVRPALAFASWNNCSQPTVSINNVVMSCQNPNFPGLPLLFVASCS
jgi:hypothetical protein